MACRAAKVLRACGAPLMGGELWHPTQKADSTSAASHGMSEETPVPPSTVTAAVSPGSEVDSPNVHAADSAKKTRPRGFKDERMRAAARKRTSFAPRSNGTSRDSGWSLGLCAQGASAERRFTTEALSEGPRFRHPFHGFPPGGPGGRAQRGPQGGSVTLPGAPLAPLWVWQLLQSPEETAVVMARVFPLKLTTAVMGNVNEAFPEKFPAPLAVKDAVAPVLSVTVTTAPEEAGASHLSGSCPVGNTVPATVKCGPPLLW